MAELTVIGIGPGGLDRLTGEALEALRAAELVVGYPLYLELVAPLLSGRESYSTPMRKETERCRFALSEAEKGRAVALVCSGDAGVYGLAGPVLELLPAYPGVTVRVVAGVTAALSGAALLGAPLGHDFCVISLSDLLTPWETIEKRLRCAAEGDFAIALYNPGSKRRSGYLRRACDVLLEKKAPGTVCGLVRQAGREGEACRLLTLGELREAEADMFTTAFVGASETRNVEGRMVTPRGYREL